MIKKLKNIFSIAVLAVLLTAISASAFNTTPTNTGGGGASGWTIAGGAITPTNPTNTICSSGTRCNIFAATLDVTTIKIGGASAFTQGSVPFIGATGTIAQDNASLFFDDTNNRLGVGTASPAYKLDIQGSSGSTALQVRGAGGGGWFMGDYNNSATYGSIWTRNVTPDTSNMTLYGNGAETYLNSTGFIRLVLSNATTMLTAYTSGVNIGSAAQATAGFLTIASDGGASKSGFAGIGSTYTAGTATTNVPYWLRQATGTTASTTWSTAGTELGINSVTGFTGNFIDMKLAGVTVFRFASNGQIVFGTSGSAIETGSEIDIRPAGGGSGLRGVRLFTNSALSSTSGNIYTVQTLGNFGAGAGSANYRAHTVEYTINNSGAQSGNSTGLYINATETALNSMSSYLIDANVAGSSKFRVFSSGRVTTAGDFEPGNDIILPSGGTLTFSSRGKFRANADGVFSMADSAGTSFGRLQFGGTTSSFPSIKRSSADIHFRLADDSAYANIRALDVNAATFSNSATGVVTFSTDTIRVTTSRTPATSSEACTAGDHSWDASYMYVCTSTNTWKRSALTAF